MIIRYTMQVEFELTDAEFRVVKRLYQSVNKVDAVRFVKDQYNLSLKQAKDICDAVADYQ